MAVVLDPQLLEVLACPCEVHAPLTLGLPSDPDADALTCTSCRRSFPVVDGIPVLLLDEAFFDPTSSDPTSSDPAAEPGPGAP